MDSSKIVFLDCYFNTGVINGNKYYLTKEGNKKEITFGEAYAMIVNKDLEQLNSNSFYSHSHYKFYMP